MRGPNDGTVRSPGRWSNLRSERQLEATAKAKAAGVYRGRPASIDAAQVRAMKAHGIVLLPFGQSSPLRPGLAFLPESQRRRAPNLHYPSQTRRCARSSETKSSVCDEDGSLAADDPALEVDDTLTAPITCALSDTAGRCILV
jgi:hypothetical protein